MTQTPNTLEYATSTKSSSYFRVNRSTRIGPWVKIGEVDDKRRKIQRNANFERPWVKIGEVDDKRRKIQRNANFERPWVKIGEVDDKRRKIQRNAINWLYIYCKLICTEIGSKA